MVAEPPLLVAMHRRYWRHHWIVGVVVFQNPNVRSCRSARERDRNDVRSRSRRDDILGVVNRCDPRPVRRVGGQQRIMVLPLLSATLLTVAVVSSFHPTVITLVPELTARQ